MAKIVSQIVGGVGNQMFQYCAGYACAKKLGFDFYLDITEFDEYKLRKYELNKFNIEENFALKDTVQKLNKNTLFRHSKFSEKKLDFNFSQIKGDSYLTGYFQSEKYFKTYEKDIKEQFTFKDYSFLKDLSVLSEITNTNSVSISLRFGDYVGNPMYDILKEAYYRNCINYFKGLFGDNLKFFVLSDNIEASKNVLKNFDVNYVTSSSWAEDMYFIQNCKHNIIANSSFAWWGAWLNKNKEKIVLAPSVWYGTDEIDFKDIVPDNWIKMEIN